MSLSTTTRSSQATLGLPIEVTTVSGSSTCICNALGRIHRFGTEEEEDADAGPKILWSDMVRRGQWVSVVYGVVLYRDDDHQGPIFQTLGN